MPVNYNSSRPQGAQPLSNSITVHTPAAGQAATPLNHLALELQGRLNQLMDRGLLPDTSMPAIQDRHASLFFIAADDNATPVKKRITTYVNTILAAKEHLAQMATDLPAKAPLADLLKQHEAIFNELNDVAIMLSFAREPDNIERAIGHDLLETVARDAMKAFITASIASDTIATQSAAIRHIKNEREAQFKVSFEDSWINGQWPQYIMPLSLLSALTNASFQHYPPAEGICSVASLFTLLKMVDNSKANLGPEHQLLEQKHLDKIARIFKAFGETLSAAEKKRGLKPDSITKFMSMLLVMIERKLDSESGLELRKVSYETARHAPQMVMQERGKKTTFDEYLSLYENGPPVKQLSLILSCQKGNCQEKSKLLKDFKIAVDDFKLDEGLSVAENIANFFLDSQSRFEILQAVNHFLDGKSTSSAGQQEGGKTSSKRQKKAQVAAANLDQCFEKIAAFIHRNIPQAVPSSEQKYYGELIQHWTKGTFDSLDKSIHYHQGKHAPDDDKISYMAEAREYMQRELRCRPPCWLESHRGVMTRRSRNDEFLRLLRTGADGAWKIVSFHSPRFTHQGYEADGKAKLKLGEQPHRYVPQAPESMSNIEQRLKAANIV